MATALSTFRESVRVLIGDNDPDIHIREDAQLDAAMRLVLDCGNVKSGSVTYAVDALRTGVTPDLTAADDPTAFAKLVYHTAKQFRIDSSQIAWRTRAFSEVVGENRESVFHILDELFRLDFGDYSASSDYD